MTSLKNNTPLVRNPDLVAAEVDGDLVMMSIDRGEYYGIGGVGTRVWELLAQPTSLAEIVQVICSEYKVDQATCGADIKDFLEKMIKNDIVVVH